MGDNPFDIDPFISSDSEFKRVIEVDVKIEVDVEIDIVNCCRPQTYPQPVSVSITC